MVHDLHFTSQDAQVFGLGVVAGMRSQLPLALLAIAASRDQFAAGSESPLHLPRTPVVQRVLAVSAAGELIADKLPFTPSRLSPGPLVGRMFFGGLAGAAIATAARRSPMLGAVLGAGGAVIGAQTGYQTRVALGRVTGLPDPVWGAAEDIAAIGLGLLVLRSLRTSPEM